MLQYPCSVPGGPTALLLFAALALCACGSDDTLDRHSTRVEVADYATTCEAAADCAAVAVGQFCPCPPCANAAINASDLGRYQAKVSAIHCSVSGKCGACGTPPAVDCVDGGCTLK
jgi:hypothetical protein